MTDAGGVGLQDLALILVLKFLPVATLGTPLTIFGAASVFHSVHSSPAIIESA